MAKKKPGGMPEGAISRITELVNQFGSRTNAARIAGISTDQLSRYLTGLSQPSIAPIASMASKAGINLHWIWTGEPPKFLESAVQDEFAERLRRIKESTKIVEKFANSEQSKTALSGIDLRELLTFVEKYTIDEEGMEMLIRFFSQKQRREE